MKLNLFLTEQLCGAVALLRAKEETEEQYNAKYRAIYQDVEKRLQKQVEEIKQSCTEEINKARADATRYRFIRQHQVQAWALGVVAQGEQLDKALDEQIERAQKKTA